MQTNLRRFDARTKSAKLFIIKADEVVKLNREQMLEGIKKTGEKIGTYKSARYAARKAELNPKAGKGNVDLKFTGRFQKAMKTEIKGGNIDIASTDKKAGKLISKYGTDIYGLTKANWQIWLDKYFMPDFWIELQKATGLKV